MVHIRYCIIIGGYCITMNGKQHDKITRITTVPVALTAGIISGDPYIGMLCAASYFISGYYLSPDLDCHSLPYKRWGILRYIWEPYQTVIGGHKPATRNIWSHCPVMGITIRLLYLYFVFSAPVYGINFILSLLFDAPSHLVFDTVTDFIFNNQIIMKYFYIGMIGGEISHLLADHAYSFNRKLSR